MDLEKLYSKTGGNYKTVLTRFCNNKSLIEKFVASFPQDATYQKLIAAVTDQDYVEIENQAHALKGASGNLGFDKLQAACADVVICIRQNNLHLLPKKVERLEQEYNVVICEIQNLL